MYSKKIRAAFPINSLPDELIVHILSFLTIQEAVRTSVLSRDWERKWTSMYDLNIDYKSFSGRNKVAMFVNVVCTILLAARNNLHSFRLSCGKISDSSYLASWISGVLTRNVQNLVIVAPKVRDLNLSSRCFERCTSLTELKLSVGDSTLTLPTQRCLLNLKSLSLGGDAGLTSILNHESAYSGQGHVLLDFPVLEILELKVCRWLNVKIVEIRAPKLRKYKAAGVAPVNNYSIKICGPRLATFESAFYFIEDYILNAPGVTSATLNHSVISTSLPSRAHKVLNGFPKLARLKVSGRVVQAFNYAKSGHVTPIFVTLKQLELCSSYSTNDLLKFLKVAPFLESLSLTMQNWEYDYMHDYDYGHQGEANLPQCIKSCVKEVKFLMFMEKDAHVEFAKLILETAENLHTVVISIKGSSWIKGMKNRLLSTIIPISPTCVVKVYKQSRHVG